MPTLLSLKRFPKKEQAKDSLLQVAKIYERLLEFDKASVYFLDFHKRYPKEKSAAGSLSKACELQLALNTSKALSICNAFANRYPDSAKEVVERLIIGAFRGKRNAQMVKIINSMYLSKFKLNQNEKIAALYRIYTAFGRQGSQAGSAARSIEAEFRQAPNRVSGEALRYVGEIAFLRANAVLPNYLKIRLTGGTVEQLLASLQAKAAALGQVEQAYSQVVATKDSYWGVAALYSIGIANEQFAELLANPPPIKGAKRADVLAQLKPQIDQVRAAAANWYKTAADTFSKFRVYNEYSIKTINALARVSGKNFQFDDYVFTPDFLGSEMPASLANSFGG